MTVFETIVVFLGALTAHGLAGMLANVISYAWCGEHVRTGGGGWPRFVLVTAALGPAVWETMPRKSRLGGHRCPT